jgi:hypothetical protein
MGTTIIKKQSFIKTRILFRIVSGRPIDGIARTDSRFFHRGTRALTQTGHASAWAYLAGWQRAAIRLGVPVGMLGVLILYFIEPIAFYCNVAAYAGIAVWLMSRQGMRFVRTFKYNREVVTPLVSALSPAIEMPAKEIAQRIIVPNDGQVAELVRVPLPDHFGGKQAQVADVTRIVSQRIGGEWDSSLQMRRAPFYLNFTPKPVPPSLVSFDMVRDAILATTQDKPVLGLGARAETVHLDFTGEIAHLAASIGTGGGKSSLLRLLVAQFAYHGVKSFTVCDVKWVSLQGMEEVPGLKVYRDVEDIWDAIALERAEMDRRYKEMLANPNRVFPRRVLILEEQNAFALETMIRWREVRPQGDKRNTAPVWNDIGLLLLKARQVNMNLIGVYQRMTADSTGGGTYRDQYGLKLLSRFSIQAWDTLVGTRPRGVSSAIPGRSIAVLGGLQRQVQLPFISVKEAMELVRSGPHYSETIVSTDSITVNVPVAGESDVTHKVTETGTETGTVPAVIPLKLFTIAEAAKQTDIGVTYNSMRVARERDPQFPTGTLVGTVKKYTLDELRDWANNRQRTRTNGAVVE